MRGAISVSTAMWQCRVDVWMWLTISTVVSRDAATVYSLMCAISALLAINSSTITDALDYVT